MTDQTLAAADPGPADASYFSRFRGMRDFLLVWTGLLISGIGTRFSAFALGIWVLEKTGSTLDFAMIFVAMSIPALIVLPFAGALVDRWNRRRVMIACELGSAGTIAGLATLNAFDLLQIWHSYVGVGVSALCNAFMQPAYGASVPLLASPENLSRANGLIQTGNAIALLGGPLLAGILYKIIGIAGILFVDAATFLAGALCLFLARVPQLVLAVLVSPAFGMLADTMDSWKLDRIGLTWVPLFLQLFFSQGFGITVLGLTGFTQIHFDKFCP